MKANPAAPIHHRVCDLVPDQLGALCALYDRIWPVATGGLLPRANEVGAGWVREGREVFIVWDRAAPIATAMVFPREIMTSRGALRVLALAGVCTAPECRGRGFGAAVVRAAFAQVDRGAFSVALFQTAVPDFYAKLGARTVSNAFVNSRYRPGDRGSAEHPWWDPNVMIYPAAFRWPEGPIDLLGEGF
ncbi:MAG: GNAT family N-acetyltransferase [Opitutaceae bacterium]|nr:GNAT family N-acetyltransferase [Opitutaceae bacterium]